MVGEGSFWEGGAQESIKTMEIIVLNIVHFILIANYNGLISIPMQWICRTSQIFHLQFNFPENKSICKWSVKSTPVICYQRLMFVNQSKTHTYNNWKKLKGCSWLKENRAVQQSMAVQIFLTYLGQRKRYIYHIHIYIYIYSDSLLKLFEYSIHSGRLN